MGRIASSLLRARKAASASVSWMYWAPSWAGAGHGDLVQRGHTRVALQEPADPSLDARLLGELAGLHPHGQPRQVRFEASTGTLAHGPFFRPTRGGAAAEGGFV